MIKRLVLLPGLDGTGELFADFVKALPPTVETSVIQYPNQELCTYAELYALVRVSVADLEPFVLLGESFSSPLAIHVAGSRLPNLAGLVICAGFVANPFPHLGFLMKLLAKPFLFRLPTPDFVYQYYVTGWSGTAALRRKIRENLRPVAPGVLAGRVQEILTCDAREDLVRTNVPIMDLRGAYDRLIDAKCGVEIQKVRAGIRRVSLPAPHLVLQSRPYEASEAVMRFIREIESGQAVS